MELGDGVKRVDWVDIDEELAMSRWNAVSSVLAGALLPLLSDRQVLVREILINNGGAYRDLGRLLRRSCFLAGSVVDFSLLDVLFGGWRSLLVDAS